MNNALSIDKEQVKLGLLADIPQFWQRCYFVPWEWNGLQGVHRRITFKKSSLLGEVASYFVDDYIVWSYEGRTQEFAVKRLLEAWRPETDVMSHRFLVLGERTGSRPQRRHYWLGIRGWLEVLPYCPGEAADDKFKDLAYLADFGLDAVRKGGRA